MFYFLIAYIAKRLKMLIIPFSLDNTLQQKMQICVIQ